MKRQSIIHGVLLLVLVVALVAPAVNTPAPVLATDLPACNLTPADRSVTLSLAALSSAPGVAQVVHVSGYVDVQDISRSELYDYVVNLENDPLWYPGTLSSEQICGGHGASSQYREVVALTGTPLEITATVMRVIPNHSVWFKSDNVLPNVTNYLITTRRDQITRLTLSSSVGVPEGSSQADIEAFLELILNTLLSALGKQGTVVIS